MLCAELVSGDGGRVADLLGEESTVTDLEREPEGTRGVGQVRMPLGWQIAVWLTLGVVVTVGAGALLWWGLGSPAITGPNALKPQEKFDLIKIALAVTGGIGGVIFLVIAYRKQRLGEAAERRENAKGRREDAKEERENVKLLNERFATAAAQLSHDEAAARLAGAYAMEALADDWKARRQTCINVLCAYIRMHYNHEPPEDPDALRKWHGERQVRDTVIRIITAHLRAEAAVSWQGYDFDFTGAVFDSGDFTKASFAGGTVTFQRAEFVSGHVDFGDTKFSGGIVDFSDATFSGGTVAFRGARFSGGTVRFGRVKFASGTIDLYCAELSDGAVYFGGGPVFG